MNNTAITNAQLEQFSVVQEQTDLISLLGIREVTNAQKIRAVKAEILALDAEISLATGDQLSKLRQEKILQEAVLKLLESRLEKITSLISGASQSTGVGIEKVADSISKKYDIASKSVTLFGVALKKTGGGDLIDYAEQDEGVKKLIDGFVLADTTLVDLNKAFNEGTTSSGSFI